VARTVIVDDAVQKVLARLPRRLQGQIGNRLDGLAQNAHPLRSKKMHNMCGPQGEAVYRERSGDFRILYIIRETEIVVLDIGDRKDVYK
jgi:mRNA interferase RelE/StbE